jgi:hypothetical protein
VEAQCFDPVDLVESHRFDDVNTGGRIVKARELAIAWAHEKRKAIEHRFEADE